MQATREWSVPWERVMISSAKVFAVSAVYQNWLSLQSSETRETSSAAESESATEWFCSERNSLRAARAAELKTGGSSSSSTTAGGLGFGSIGSITVKIFRREREMFYYFTLRAFFSHFFLCKPGFRSLSFM